MLTTQVPVPSRRLGRDLLTAPNLVTLSRVALMWTAVSLFAIDLKLPGVLLGIAAGLTDTLDGILARRLGQVTALGRVLDLLADLVFESTGIFMGTLWGGLPAVCLVIYLAREFFVVSARSYCAQLGQTIPSSFLGRVKSSVFGYAFMFLFTGLGELLPWSLGNRACLEVGVAGVSVGLAISVVSGLGYLRQFVRLYQAAAPAGD
jgi:CDP-diacylglycerol--glycerol-3-phosphate 3-phosphatidyltransferase